MLDQELQHALAFYQPPPQSWYDALSNKTRAAGEWLWETLQGDFNEQQTTGQIVTGTVISMIPLVDQICDVRDLIANCKKIKENDAELWPWVCLGLTLIGCFPTLGSLAKGSAKVMFLAVRRSHFTALNQPGHYSRLLDESVRQFNRLLATPAVRTTLRTLRIYNPYPWLADKFDALRQQLNTSALLAVMDQLLHVTRSLFDTVTRWGPASLQRPVAALWDTLVAVRARANTLLAQALKPLTELLEHLANRLRIEGDNAFRVHVGDNAHLYGAARAREELAYLQREKPDWVDMGVQAHTYKALRKMNQTDIAKISRGWPDISKTSPNPVLEKKFNTFDSSMHAAEIPPGTVLYRVVDPASTDNSICWMRQAEFDRLTNKSDWRRHFAVWKHWNENGEFVTYTVPPGPPLKVWEGRAATQVNEHAAEYTLEGGWNQVVLDPAQLKKEFAGPRQKTGWGYTDAASDPVYPYLGLPKLETTHNWYEPQEKK